MWRPAVWRFGVCLAVVACGGNRSAPTTIDNRGEPVAARDLTGAYWCSIEDGGYTNPPFPCAIRKVDDRLVLAKLGGSQRFEGVIEPQGDGFSFDGRFYCPWGDCSQELHGQFRPWRGHQAGTLRGAFRDAAIVVLLARDVGDGLGGAGYGGTAYGGANYRFSMGNSRP